MDSIEFDRLTRAMSALQDRRRALRLAAGVALAGVVGSASIGRSGVTLVLDAEAKKKKKKKKKKQNPQAVCQLDAATCTTDVQNECTAKFPNQTAECVASFTNCCSLVGQCLYDDARACVCASPFQDKSLCPAA
jgi:hypothetical protein